MKQVTVKCTQCPKEFSHPTEEKAQQAMRMHVGRMHKGNIKTGHEHSGVLRQGRNGKLTALGNGKVTRTYRRKPVVQQVAVNFCPCCGTDLHAVATGMAMAAHLKK